MRVAAALVSSQWTRAMASLWGASMRWEFDHKTRPRSPWHVGPLLALTRTPQLACILRKLKTKPNGCLGRSASWANHCECLPNQTSDSFSIWIWHIILYNSRRPMLHSMQTSWVVLALVEIVIHNVEGDVKIDIIMTWTTKPWQQWTRNIRESKFFSVNIWNPLGEQHVSAYLLTLTFGSTRFPMMSMSTGCSLTWDVMRDWRQHIPCLLFGIPHFVTLTSTNLPFPRLYFSSKSHTNPATCIVPRPRASVELHQDNLLCADWSGRRGLLHLKRFSFISKFILFTLKNSFQVP